MAWCNECGHNCRMFLVNIVHIIDVLVGLLVLSYGVAIRISYASPGLPTFFIAFGSVLLSSVILGVIGLRTAKCSRVGILVSALLAIPIAIVYISFALYIIAGKENWIAYVKSHQEELYLNNVELGNVEKGAPIFFIVGIVCGVLELCRLFAMLRLRKDMRASDQSSRSDNSQTEQLLSGDSS